MDRTSKYLGLPPKELMETVHLRGWCKPRLIGYLNAIIDAHEGLGVVRTIDADTGEVEFWATKADQETLESVLKGLSEEISLRVEGHYG